VLARMDPIASKSVPIAAVALRRMDDLGSRIQLIVNVEWFDAHPELRAGVLLHEIQHVLLGHITSPILHAVAYPRVMEVAMEISADEPIAGLVPSHGFDIPRWSRFGVAPGQSTLERYRLLADAFEDGRLSAARLWFPGMRDSHRLGSHAVGIGDLLDARSDGATERTWSRAGRHVDRPSSRREIERMKLEIARHLRGERGGDDDPTRATQRRIAKDLGRVVYETERGRFVDWARTLREAFPRRRAVRPDYLRPNRRFSERVGEIPGRARRPPRPALLVAVDTSGSMTGEVLDRVAKEVRRLAHHARVTIVECDAAVHRVYPLTRQLGPFVGGGDTDFAPVFDEARASLDFEGVVYFTDGKGAMPDLVPTLPVLWAITHEDPFLADWGRIVRVPA